MQYALPPKYRFERQRLSRADLDDLLWFRFLLEKGRLHAILTTLVAFSNELPIFLYLHAWDDGLCMLNLGTEHYIALQWDTEELRWIQRLNDANSGRINPTRRIQCKRPHPEMSDASHIEVDFYMFAIDVRDNLSGALVVLVLGHVMGAAARGTHPHPFCWKQHHMCLLDQQTGHLEPLGPQYQPTPSAPGAQR